VHIAATMNDLMRDVVDSILRHLPSLDQPGDSVAQNKLRVLVAALESILTQSSSAFAVDFSDGMHLAQRVDRTAEQASADAVEHAGHASGLLKTAWSATFQREPNPSYAYRDAVLAVEFVACQTFTSAKEQASLGDAISCLESTLATWTVATLTTSNKPLPRPSSQC
jgi:hypothetical protein